MLLASHIFACSFTVYHHDAGCQVPIDGSITVVDPIGASPFTYSLNGGAYLPISSWSSLTAGTYTIEMKDNSGCTYTASVIVKYDNTICCTSSSCIPAFYGTWTASAFAAEVSAKTCHGSVSSTASGVVISNVTDEIVINGTITLDEPLEFIGCPNIWFGKYGNILVAATTSPLVTLQVISSTMKPCGSWMWEGIEADGPNAQVITDISSSSAPYTQIIGAMHGIKLINGGRCEVNFTDFYANYVSVLSDGVPYLNDFSILNSNFYPGYGLVTYYNHLTNALQIDALFGVWIINNNSSTPITIGQFSSAPGVYTNLFNGAFGAAIECDQISNVTVLDNEFFDVQSAIVCNGISGGTQAHINPNSILTVGDATNPLGCNKFWSFANGVMTTGYVNTYIDRDTFLAAAQSDIFIKANIFGTINIENNQCILPAGETPNGIVAQDCQYGTLYIYHNNLKLIDLTLTSVHTATVGIFLNAITSEAATIQDNTIRQTDFGIYDEECIGLNVFQNHIYPEATAWTLNGPPPYRAVGSGPYWAGMYDVVGTGNSYEENWVQFDSHAGTPSFTVNNNINGKLFGFLGVDPTKPVTLNCNFFENVHIAIASRMGTAAAYKIASNNFQTCRAGVGLFDAGYIGNQGSTGNPSDNRWNMGTGDLAVGPFSSNGSANLFYVRNTYTWYDPAWTPQYRVLPGTLFPTPIVTTGSTPTTCTYTTPQTFLGPGLDASRLDSMATGGLAYADFQTANQKWAYEELVSIIRHHPALDSLPLLDSFTVHTAADAFSILITVADSMTSDSLSTTAIASLLALNASADPTDQNETNLQVINGIYLNSFAQYTFALDSADSAAVLSVAQQCYITGGPAVLRARSMYSIATATCGLWSDSCISEGDYGSCDTTYFGCDSVGLLCDSVYVWYDTSHISCDSVCTKSGFAFTETPKEVTNPTEPYSFQAYPNPLGHDQPLTIQSSEAGVITFYSALGQIIFSSNVAVGYNNFDYANLGNNTNLLFFKAQMNSGKTESGKVSLIK